MKRGCTCTVLVAAALAASVLACGTDPAASDETTTGEDGSSSSAGASEATTQPSTSAPTSEATTEATTASSSDGVAECEVDADCLAADAPVCLGGICLGCEVNVDADAACANLDATKPVCGADGSCVQCTSESAVECVSTTPTCDVATNTCTGCTAHEQCLGTACDVDTGACFSDACLLVVDADGGGDFLDVESAVQSVAANESCVIQIRRPGDGSAYLGQISVTSGRRIALVGVTDAPEDEPPRLVASDSVTVFGIDTGAVVYLSGIRLGQGEVQVGAAKVWLDRTDVQNSFGVALRTVDPQAYVTLVNSWLDGDGFDEGAVIVEAGRVDAVFTTIVGYSFAVSCDPSAVTHFRNSLLLNSRPENEVDCPGIDIAYSALENQYAGVGNQALGPIQAEWFSWEDEVVRLSAEAPALLGVTARWTLGDPSFDIDGDPRPDLDGVMHFAGADVTR